MSDTVELRTLRDENADLRRQLAEVADWKHSVLDAETIKWLQNELAEAQRQRDEAQAACAKYAAACEWMLSTPEGYKLVSESADYSDVWIESGGDDLIVADNPGRDFLARLEAAQRTAQAADGLAELVKSEMEICAYSSQGMRANTDQSIQCDCGQCQRNAKRTSALAIFQATKEQK